MLLVLLFLFLPVSTAQETIYEIDFPTIEKDTVIRWEVINYQVNDTFQTKCSQTNYTCEFDFKVNTGDIIELQFNDDYNYSLIIDTNYDQNLLQGYTNHSIMIGSNTINLTESMNFPFWFRGEVIANYEDGGSISGGIGPILVYPTLRYENRTTAEFFRNFIFGDTLSEEYIINNSTHYGYSLSSDHEYIYDKNTDILHRQAYANDIYWYELELISSNLVGDNTDEPGDQTTTGTNLNYPLLYQILFPMIWIIYIQKENVHD